MVLGLARLGAAASVTPAPGGPACPVHLNKLRLTGAQSPWSRSSPVASLVPITQRRVWPTGWDAAGDAGRVGCPNFFLVLVWCQDQPRGHFLVRLWEVLEQCVAHCLPSRLM